MFELLAVIGAFFLYLLVLPLFGLIVAVCCITVLPYLLGAAVVYGLLSTLVSNISAVALLLTALVIWSVPVLFVRYWPNHTRGALNWYDGHYRAAGAVMTFGLFARQREAVNSAYALKTVVARLKAG